MSTYYSTRKVNNPNLIKDIIKFITPNTDESSIETIIASNSVIKIKMEVLVDRLELCENLNELRQMMISEKKINGQNIIEQKIVDGKIKIEEIELIEEIIFNDKEMTGVDYDLEALIQYLYLTCIDTIMGEIDYEDFVTWIKKREKDKYEFTISELDRLNEGYKEENGLRRNFRKAFTLLSDDTKQRITNNFLIGKLDDGKLNEESEMHWNSFDDNNKIYNFSKYLYDDIRCRYTHSCFRNFLPTTPVDIIPKSTTKKIIAKKSPSEEAFNILLKDICVELIKKQVLNIEY